MSIHVIYVRVFFPQFTVLWNICTFDRWWGFAVGLKYLYDFRITNIFDVALQTRCRRLLFRFNLNENCTNDSSFTGESIKWIRVKRQPSFLFFFFFQFRNEKWKRDQVEKFEPSASVCVSVCVRVIQHLSMLNSVVSSSALLLFCLLASATCCWLLLARSMH